MVHWSEEEAEALKLAVEEHNNSIEGDASTYNSINMQAVYNTFNDLVAGLPVPKRTIKAVESKIARNFTWGTFKFYEGVDPGFRNKPEVSETHLEPPEITAFFGTAAETQQRRKAAIYALKELAHSTNSILSTALFSTPRKQWSHTMIKNLVNYGYVEKTDANNRFVSYRAVDRDALLQFVEDPTPLFSALFSPSSGSANLPNDVEMPPTPSDEVAHESEVPSDEPTEREMLAAAVKLIAHGYQTLQMANETLLRIEAKLAANATNGTR